MQCARATARLKARARSAGIPVIYVNDNFHRWHGGFDGIVAHCTEKSAASRAIVDVLMPEPDDYIVVKPKNSAFFDTGLGTLLDELRVSHLILTGLVTDNCILFTANDAHLRDYEVLVPSDCVAAKDRKSGNRALEYMAANLHAKTGPAKTLRLSRRRR